MAQDWYLNPNIFDDEEKKDKETSIIPTAPRNDFSIPSQVESLEKIQEGIPEGDSGDSGDWGDFWKSMGQHVLSSATMGLTEFADDEGLIQRTEDWRDKNAKELWGSALGEAAGFLIPIKYIGMGVRGAKSLINQGSKAIARTAAKEAADLAGSSIAKASTKAATQTISEKSATELIENTLRHESGSKWWQLRGDKVDNLYRYEVGGETLARAEGEMGRRVSARLGVEFKEAGIDVSASQVDDIVTGYLKGLQNGKHHNTFFSWGEKYAKSLPTNAPMRRNIGKWAAQAADETIILGADGIIRDYIRSKYTSDDEVPHQFAPGTSLMHSALLGAAFPAIRSGFGLPFLKWGGKEKLGDGLKVLFSKWKNVDYAGKATTAQGRAELKALLGIMRGSKQATKFVNKDLTINGKSGYVLDDILDMNLNNEAGGNIAVQALNQLRSGESSSKALAEWAMDYSKDLVGSLPRMAVGAAVMNKEALVDPQLMNADPNEILPHMMVAAFMTKGRKGWMEGEMATKNVDNYLATMRLLNINPDGLANMVNYASKRQEMNIQSRGLLGSDSAADIHDIYDTEMRISKKTGRKRETPIPTKYHLVQDYYDIYHRKGWLEDPEFEPLGLEYLTNRQLGKIDAQLRGMDYGGKKLSDFPSEEWFDLERVESNKGVESAHMRWLERLNKDGIIDAQYNESTGKMEVGRVDRNGKGTEHAELDRMLLQLQKLGLVTIRTEWGKKDTKRTDVELREEIEAFKSGLESDNIGAGINVSWDVDNNLFLDEMSAVRRTQTENILQKSVAGDAEGLSETQATFKERAVDPYLLDENGRMVEPHNIEVKAKELNEIAEDKISDSDRRKNNFKREELENALREVGSIYYHGSVDKSTSGQKVKVDFEAAQAIVDQFHAMELPMNTERLLTDQQLSSTFAKKIKMRRFNKLYPDPLQLEMVTDLEDAGFGWFEPSEERYFLYSYEQAHKIAKENSSSLTKEQYQDIVNYLGDKVEIVGDKIRESDVPVDISAIERLHSKIPAIRDKMIVEKVIAMNDKMIDVNLDSGKEVVNTLRDALAEGDPVKASKALELIAEKLPTLREDVNKIKREIEADRVEELRLDEIFQAAAGTEDLPRWLDAVKESFETEKMHRLKGQTMLKHMLAERNNSLFYVKNITRELENSLKRQGESLEDLVDEYIKHNGFYELRRVLNGVYQGKPRGIIEADIHYDRDTENFRKDLRNDIGGKTRSVIEILDTYGFKTEGTNDIKETVLEKLRTAEGVQELITDISLEHGELAAEQFFRRDLNPLLAHYDVQKKIVRARLKDNKLVFEFDVPTTETRDYTLTKDLQDRGIKIIDMSSQAFDKGLKALELVQDLNSKIRGSEILIDTKELMKEYSSGETEEMATLMQDAIESRLSEIDGKYEILLTGYSKPKIFETSPENIKRINEVFQSELGYVLENAPTEVIRQNIERAFKRLSDPATQLRFMHWFNTNGKLSYDLFTNDNITDAESFGSVSRRYIKYSTLFANDLSKPVSKELLAEIIEKNTGMDPMVEDAMMRIYDKFDEIGIVVVADEVFADRFTDIDGNIMETNLFNNRKSHIEQIIADRDMGGLPEDQANQMIRKFSDQKRFQSLDTSGWDGNIIISKDIYLASMGMRADGLDVNALKPTIFHNTGMSTLLGKGQYVYIPEISDHMDARGIQMIMGGSAAKSVRGMSRTGQELQIVGGNIDNVAQLLNVGNNAIMDISFSDQGIVKTAHGSTKAPISHTITYGATNEGVKDIRNWMQLDDTIQNAINWDKDMKRAASTNLSKVLMQMESEGGFEAEGLGQVRDMVNLYNYHQTHPHVKQAIFRLFKDRMLNKLNKPMAGGKQGRYYIYPDMALSNPYYQTFKDSKGNEVEVQTQFGEMDLPYEYAHGSVDGLPLRQVHNLNELQFSFREGGIDYMVEYNGGKLLVTDNISDYAAHDYKPQFAYEGRPEVPQGLKNLLDNLKVVMDTEAGKTVLGDGSGFTFGRIAQTFNALTVEHAVDASILAMVERGPRKGISDYQITKVRRILPKEYGPMAAVNGYDVRLGLQGDWDGDAINIFYGMARSKARSAMNDAGLVPDYTNLPSEPFKLNPFGIDFNTGEAGPSKAGSIEEYMRLTKAGEIAMGKTLGLNNALSWMLNSGFQVGNLDINAGLDLGSKIKYRKNFQHFANSSQSVVDFASGPNTSLLENPVRTIFFSEGTELMGGRGEADRWDQQIVEIALDAMRRPARLFNDVTDRAGKHKPRVDEIEGMYNDLREFFYDPNTYILKELLRRNKKLPQQDIQSIINKFYDTTGMSMEDYGDFLRKVKGKKKDALPMRDGGIVKFGKDFQGIGAVKKLIDISDSGYLVRQIAEQKLFNDRGFIEAWDINTGSSKVSDYANMIMNATQVFEIGRMLGAKEGEYSLEDFGNIFGYDQLAKGKDVRSSEHLAMLETALDYEFEGAHRKFAYLQGNKYSNEYDLSRAEDRVIALSRARDYLGKKIIEQALPDAKTLQKTRIITIGKFKDGKPSGSQKLTRPFHQKGYSYFYKVQDNWLLKNAEGEITGVNAEAVSRTPIIVKAGQSLRKDKYGNPLKGTYIELKNPIATKRLSADDTIEGYLMHLYTKNNPITFLFPEDMGRSMLEQSLVETRRAISDAWSDTIDRLKKGSEYKDEIFTLSEAEIASTLHDYFRENAKHLIGEERMRELDLKVEDLNEKELGVYFLAKTLLTPTPMARMKVGTDAGAAPYFYINSTLSKQVRSYLYKNHPEVWKIMAADMGNIYDFMVGRAEGYEAIPDKSPFYTGKNFYGAEGVDVIVNKTPAIFRYGVTPDVGMILSEKGVMSVGDVEYDPAGVGYREVKSLIGSLPKWEDIKVPKCY